MQKKKKVTRAACATKRLPRPPCRGDPSGRLRNLYCSQLIQVPGAPKKAFHQEQSQKGHSFSPTGDPQSSTEQGCSPKPLISQTLALPPYVLWGCDKGQGRSGGDIRGMGYTLCPLPGGGGPPLSSRCGPVASQTFYFLRSLK